MVDYNVVIPGGGGSNALNPLALMALQQRSQLGQGNLAYKEQLLALKQQQVDNALANAAAGRAKSDFEVNQMKAVKDVLANRVSPAVVGTQGIASSGTGLSTDPNADLYNKILDTGDIKSANEFLTGQKTAADVQSAVTKSIDDRLDLWKNKAPSVTTPEDAGAFSLAMQQDPLLSQFSHIVGDPQAAAAKSAALFAKDPQAWYTSMVKLTGEQFITAIKPTLKEVGTNQNLVSVSPSGEVKTLMEGENKKQSTSDERNMSILGKVLTDSSFANTPEYAQAYALMSLPKLINQVGPNGEMIPVYVKRDLPTWAVPPTAGAAPTTEQPNQLPGVQATAVPSGAVANTLRMMQGNGTAAPTVNNLGAARPDLSSMVTKAAPTQILNVTGEGQFVVNPDTGLAKPIRVEGQEAPLGREKQAEGKLKVDAILKDLAKNYATLNDLKGMPSERASTLSNIKNYTAATHLGQEISKAISTPEQTQRNLITSAARDLLEQIKIATGMGTQELNSNFELENMLKTVTDPTQSMETIKARLASMAKQFGSGKLDINKILGKSDNTSTTSAAKPMLTPPPKAVDMLKKDPSTRDHFDEIFGAGAAAKILGQ
jgi:hypothetical protein